MLSDIISSLDGDYVELEDGLSLAEEWDYEPELPEVEDWEYHSFSQRVRENYHMSSSEFVESAILMPNPNTRTLEPFSFGDRRYLRQIYDSPHKRILLKCGRQVEKSQVETEPCLTADGRFVPIKDVKLGTKLACLETFEQFGHDTAVGARTTTSEVIWKSSRYKKSCVKITTRQGHSVKVALTHPIRVWDAYLEASQLEVGSRIAVVRKAGVFLDEAMPESRVRLEAFMLGDGVCGEKQVAFTNGNFDVLDDFVDALDAEGMGYTFQSKPGTKAVVLQLPKKKAKKLRDWLIDSGLEGTNSYTKFIPEWVFKLPREQTAIFINRLWSTDGHVKLNSATKWSIEYCSMSRRLVQQLQALLWKFGIPSKIRENWPSIYKKRSEKKLAYVLRIETQEGVRAFVRDIGALGKINVAELPTWDSNSNRDTYPQEVSDLVREIYDSSPHYKGRKTIRAAGLERLPRPQYCLTKNKLREFVEFFEEDGGYDSAKVALLRAHLDSDIYWDEVAEIEDIGEQWCYDITVADHHNFVSGAIITHNSTFLGNKLFSMACLIPHFKVLYVSPSAAQTKEFSKTRIKELLETCPTLRMWFPNRLTDNVFEKRALNRAVITLRYAFLNADRTRGLSSDIIAVDEVQDQILENIPVIEETASHSPYKYFLYSGTPKSLDNPIEHFWTNYSTCNEWVVPCERHGVPGDPSSWHWNILGERNIGKKGLICDKCGGPINAMHPKAQWARTATPDPSGTVYEGFRIPQLMVPWISWKDLLGKYQEYPRSQFYNEVMGLSFDSGQRPLTRADILKNCNPEMRLSPAGVKKWRERLANVPLYAGIDWGQDSTNSYTVIKIAGYFQGKLQVIFAHRFTGAEAEPKPQLDKIFRIIETFGVQKIGADYGGGHFQNKELLRRYGSGRVVLFQYSQPNVYMRWDSKMGRYVVHRTEIMSLVFNCIKRGGVFSFPHWEDFATPYASDMLSVFSEYNERMHMTQYKKSPNNTDDSFHALVMLFLASCLEVPRTDIFVPSARIDQLMSED